MVHRVLPVLVVLSSAILLVAGCGGATGGSVGSPVRVSGTIFLDDKPLDNATISFVPDGAGQQANGISGTDGRYRLTTRNSGDGAVPGKYKVVVKKGSAAGDQPLAPGSADYDKMMKERMMRNKPGGVAKSKNEGGVHSNYSGHTKTPLTFEVPAGGSSSLDIRLTSSGN